MLKVCTGVDNKCIYPSSIFIKWQLLDLVAEAHPQSCAQLIPKAAGLYFQHWIPNSGPEWSKAIEMFNCSVQLCYVGQGT